MIEPKFAEPVVSSYSAELLKFKKELKEFEKTQDYKIALREFLEKLSTV